MTLFKFSKLFLLLGCLILLFTPITHCQDEIIDDNDNNDHDNQDDDENIDSPFGGLDDLFGGDDDFDFGNMEDFQAFFRKQIQDHTAETLVESITTTDLVLVLFINADYPEDNRIYEEFYKTQIAPQFGTGAIEAEVMLARIFVSEDSELPDYYVPNSFPAIVLFDHVRMFEYDDQMELPEFFGWFNEITSREFTELEDQASLDRFLQSDDNPKLVAFYSSRDIPELETLSDIVKREYLIHLDIRQVALCLEHCTATYKQTTFKRPSLVLFRDYEKMSSHVIMDQHLDQADAVFAFCNIESLPPLIYFDELNQTKVFGEVIKPQITLILDPQSDNNELISQFERSAYHNIDNEAKELRMTHILNFFDDHSESLQWFYNINSNAQLPRLFITETTNDLDKIYKYKYPENQPINYDNIRQFVADYRDGKLEHFFISEEIPNNEGKNVQKVVGNSYRDIVLNSDVNYVLFICPDMEDYMCSDPIKIYEEVVKKMVENGVAASGNMKFGFIDAVRNELDMDLGDSFPDIKIFKAGDKRNPVTFGGYMTADELSKWVKEQADVIEHGLNRKDNIGDKFARNIEL